jgi:ribonuclease P protein component
MQKRFTFGKPSRLHHQQSFRRVLRHGRRAARRQVVVYVDANGLSWSRLGLRVSRRVGNAVCRNRVKRLIREAFRVRRDRLPVGVDIVCLIRSPVDHSYAQWLKLLPELVHDAADGRGPIRPDR